MLLTIDFAHALFSDRIVLRGLSPIDLDVIHNDKYMPDSVCSQKQHPFTSFEVLNSATVPPNKHQAEVVGCEYGFIDIPLDRISSRINVEAEVLGARCNVCGVSWWSSSS